MGAIYRRSVILCLLALTLLIPSCTRERPLPSATNTPSDEFSAAPTQIQVTDTPPTDDGELLIDTEAATGTPEFDNEQEDTAPPETFQYTVQPGDTLLSIAIKFETDVEVIKDLNALVDEMLSVGQPLYVPYVDGMTAEGAPTPTPGPYPYVVQPGDTLGDIVVRFGVDQIAIIEYNNLLTPDSLTVGSTIMIPNYSPPVGSPSASTDATEADDETPAVSTDGSVIHTVQPGEGLFEIAEIYGVSPNEIAIANGMNDTNLLRVGQELVIPGVSPEQAARSRGSVHVVQAGESMLGIAIRYGVTTEEILAANNLADPDSLYEGQELLIPGQ